MSFATKRNKGGINWEIDIDGWNFFNLDEIGEGEKFTVNGLYINKKAKYPHPVIITESIPGLVDLPSHMIEECEEILKDSEDVADIKAGKVGAEIYTYESDKRKDKCWSIKWVDLDA